MILYKCQCGDELVIAENTEKSRKKKKSWKQKHSAPLFLKTPKRKVADKGQPTFHSYVRLTLKKH